MDFLNLSLYLGMEILLKKLGLWERLGEIENPIFWWYFIVFVTPLLLVLSIPLFVFLEAKFFNL